MNIERRFFTAKGLKIETRQLDGKDAPALVGYAAVFDSLSDDLGGFRETINQGSFVDVMGSGDTRSLWNHNSDLVLGRNLTTLILEQDKRGLKTITFPPDTQAGKDAIVSVGRGDVTQMSFAFSVGKDGAEWSREEDYDLRTITKFSGLFDVSPVTYPAFPDTSIALRSLDSFRSATVDEELKEQQRKASAIARRFILRKRLELKIRGCRR